MSPDDRNKFGFEEYMQLDKEQIYEYYRDAKCGVGIAIFKENMDKETNRKKVFR